MPSTFHFIGSSIGGLDTTSGNENLPPLVNRPSKCTLMVAENVRTTPEGGIRTRNGFTRKAALGSAAKVKSMEVLKTYDVMFANSGTKIYQSINPGDDVPDWWDIGVTRTSAARDFLFPKGKDMFATNTTDAFLRIAVSTVSVVVAASDTTITIRTGDIGNFATSGTVYIRGDAIAYTGKNSGASTLTGVTGIQAGGHPVDSIITQTSTPTAPNGSCIAELSFDVAGGHMLVGGETDTQPSAVQYSDAATLSAPELFYAFSGGSSGTKVFPYDIRAMRSGEGIVLVGMNRGLQQITGYSSGLQSNNLHDFHGAANPWSIATLDKSFAVLTPEARVIEVARTDAGMTVVDNPRRPKESLDYAIQGYVRDNADVDQTNGYLFGDPFQKTLHAGIVMRTGITEEFVFQWESRQWVHDTGKNFGCRTFFQGASYAGSEDTSGRIYLDNDGTTDDTIPISARILTGKLRLPVTGDFLQCNLRALLNETGEFDFRIYVNGTAVLNEHITAQDLIDLGILSVTSGIPIGGGQVGAEQIGSGGSHTEAYRFTLPVELTADGEDAQLEWEVSEEGSVFELRFFDLSGETEDELIADHL